MASPRSDKWMPFYVGDYLKDTMHLDAEKHGAYLLLIFAAWTSGKPLPSDDEELASIARVAPERWAAIRHTILKFFHPVEGGFCQGRVNRELAKSKKITAARSESGKDGAKARWQDDGKPIANVMANGMANGCQSDGPLHLPLHSGLKANSSLNGLRGEKFRDLGSVISGKTSKFADQLARDEHAVNQCLPHLPGSDDGERWVWALAAEDAAAEHHAQAVRHMLAAAKKAKVGWISPEERARRRQ